MGRIDDFGEKIGGAKKDLWSIEGIDIKNMDKADVENLLNKVSKENIWPKPDYVELSNEKCPECALYTKLVRDAIISKITGNVMNKVSCSAEFVLSGYVTFVTSIRNALQEMEGIEDIETARRSILTACGLNQRGSWDYNNIAMRFVSKKLVQIVKRSECEIRSQVILQGFPDEFRNDIRNARVVRLQSGRYVVSHDAKFYVGGSFDSFDEALESAIQRVDVIKKNKDSSKQETGERKKNINESDIRPQLKSIIREGPEYRHSDADPQDFLDVFNIRGGEFGNWNTEKDRQQSLNFCYDALMDLAQTLNLPAKAIGLGNDRAGVKRLGIGFGSRGKGRALASYQHSRVVINITKMKGAGALAHEWGHALDYALRSYITNFDIDKSAMEIAADYRESHDIHTAAQLANALRNIIRIINKSNFRRVSATLDKGRSKPYFSNIKELFARSFESYVQDRLERKSQYLVHSASNELCGYSIYPENPIKKELYDGIDKLIEIVRSSIFKGGVFQTVIVDPTGKRIWDEKAGKGVRKAYGGYELSDMYRRKNNSYILTYFNSNAIAHMIMYRANTAEGLLEALWQSLQTHVQNMDDKRIKDVTWNNSYNKMRVEVGNDVIYMSIYFTNTILKHTHKL